MVIPVRMELQFEESTGYLRPGTHIATWQDVVNLCGFNDHRKELLIGLRNALLNLKEAGCRVLYLDGSFVSMKTKPRDFDGAWEQQGVDLTRVDPVLLTFTNGRRKMKEKFKGELFLAHHIAIDSVYFRDFFKTDRVGIRKGVLLVDLGSLE